jgi:cytochrome b561
MRSTLVRTDRYSSVAIAFHWTIAAAIIFNLVLGLFHDGLPRDWQVMPVHKALGITILVLSVGRLAWRLAHRPPLLATNTAPWERTVALAAHWILYALMIIMPLTGWAMSSVGRNGGAPRPLTWFWLFDIPYLPVTPGVAGISHESHEILGYLMAALVVLHIAAALRHHLILRDSTLARMLPIVGSPSGSEAR